MFDSCFSLSIDGLIYGSFWDFEGLIHVSLWLSVGKKYNKKMRNNILKEVTCKIEGLVEVCSEKAVANVVSCTFWVVKLATIAGDALRAFPTATRSCPLSLRI
jgi:hypothetical protein